MIISEQGTKILVEKAEKIPELKKGKDYSIRLERHRFPLPRLEKEEDVRDVAETHGYLDGDGKAIENIIIEGPFKFLNSYKK